jgi:hypothetical protein
MYESRKVNCRMPLRLQGKITRRGVNGDHLPRKEQVLDWVIFKIREPVGAADRNTVHFGTKCMRSKMTGSRQTQLLLPKYLSALNQNATRDSTHIVRKYYRIDSPLRYCAISLWLIYRAFDVEPEVGVV